MTRDELLDKIEGIEYWQEQYAGKTFMKALRAVVDLHKSISDGARSFCNECSWVGSITIEYPCPTIRAIEKELG